MTGVVVSENPVLAVGCHRESNQQTAGVARSLLHSIGGTLGLGLGFQDGQRDATIKQKVIGNDLLCLIIHTLAGDVDTARANTQLLFPLPPGLGESWLDQFLASCPFIPCHHRTILYWYSGK